MKLQRADLNNVNWFFISLLGFVAVLPFSNALVSIFSGVILFVSLVEDSAKNKISRFRENRNLLFIVAIFLIYLVSAVFSANWSNSLYDIRKNLFYFVLPVAFILGKEISEKQKRIVFYAFILAILVSTLVALVRWRMLSSGSGIYLHKISLISHIRFSFQLILAFCFMVLILFNNYCKLNKIIVATAVIIAVYLLGFLFLQQSLTGMIALFTSTLYIVFFLVLRVHKKYRILLVVLAFIIFSAPFFYIGWVVREFYDIEEVNREDIELFTKKGNRYKHDFNNPMVENGRYVHLYIAEKELREEWNQISDYKYDSAGTNGYLLKATLLRYMTSKGLRKDAKGVKALTEQDIENVENGIANVIFQEKKFSLYPRIYQTVWEYYVYSKTGYANHQSFSQRLEFAKAAITIIKENFWFGVGTGNWENEFKQAYHSIDSRLDESLYASSHNQYLNYIVKFGFVGLSLILFFIVYPVIKTRRYKDTLFLAFLVFMFFVNFADSNFETHLGGSFFVFFYCFFLVADGENYIKLKNASF